MVLRRRLLVLMIVFALTNLIVPIASAAQTSAKGDASYRTAFQRWRAVGGFAAWTLTNTARQPDGGVQLLANAPSGNDPYPAGRYNGRNYYNGGSFILGEAIGPEVTTGFGWSEAIASWNAETPAGSWIEPQIRARFGSRWSKWYSLGVWSSDTSTVERHSVSGQGDADATVSTDTLLATNKIKPTVYQLKVRLFSANGTALPRLRNAAVVVSTAPGRPTSLQSGNPADWNTLIDVPRCSQMIYADGGEVWCSPTSTSMVMGYWGIDVGPCEQRVRAAVAGTYDWVYRGHGNWPFNTAYAANRGLEAYVTRFTSMAQAEAWIKSGVPVIFSFAWGKGELPGAGISASAGHLAVLVGFDSQGNPIVNDPAQASDAAVRVTYNRATLESLWLEHSGGTVYLVYPTGRAVPAL